MDLILVSVAPSSPYVRLFDSGPRATWVARTHSDLEILTYAGLPLGFWKRSLTDLRECLRFSTLDPFLLGTVGHDTVAVRVYRTAVLKLGRGFSVTAENQSVRKLLTFRTLAALDAAISWLSRLFRTRRLNESRSAVIQRGAALVAHRPASVSNHTAIQMDVLRYLANNFVYRGVLFCTASAYVDPHRFASWSRSMTAKKFIAGGAGPQRTHNSSRFISGFAFYLSWDLVGEILNEPNFDHSKLNDEALTEWCEIRNVEKVDLGIWWDGKSIDDGWCPLCHHSELAIVRCTNHGARGMEALRMAKLNHHHDGGARAADSATKYRPRDGNKY